MKHKCTCKHDFWRETILTQGIKNWIQKKYDEEPIVRLIEPHHILITFYGGKQELYAEIIEEIIKEYDLILIYDRKGCEKGYGKTSRFYSYELQKRGKHDKDKAHRGCKFNNCTFNHKHRKWNRRTT